MSRLSRSSDIHAHAPPEEREATHRAITLAELAGVPILIVHEEVAKSISGHRVGQ